MEQETGGCRQASITRTTKETDITVALKLDGTGKSDIRTGIGFFDHMLEGFSRHGLFDLTVQVKGDLQVDGHHTVEDTGIVLGQAIAQAIGDKNGIRRYVFLSFPWMTRLLSARLICAAGLTLNLNVIFPPL